MRFLINRTDAIGDSLLTSPMAKLIKDKYPNAHITFLVAPRSVDLFKNHPYVDSIKIYHRHARFYIKIREIINIFKTVKPTHYLYVGGGYLPNFVSWFFRVNYRGGLKSRWHTYLFLNKGVRQKRSMVTMHELEYNLNLLAPLDFKYNFQKRLAFSPEINLSNDEIHSAMSTFNKELELKNIERGHKMIFVHPGMTGHTLNWSSRNYGRLIVNLEKKFPNKYLFIVSHTPTDMPYLQGLKDILTKGDHSDLLQRVYYFNGQVEGLRNYMSVLSNAVLFVGPSTGTTHIAAALNVPTVAIYSPIKVQSALRWGPISKNSDLVKILTPDIICGEVYKCALKECPYYECMGKIEVEDVLAQACLLLD